MARNKTTSKQSAPPPAWQSIATVLLMLHLFCLAMGLVTNANGGKSMLGPALRQIPLVRQYLQFLWMDMGYDYYIASPLPEDGAHRLQLAAHPANSAEAKAKLPTPLEFIDDAMQPRIRRQRYQQLAYHVAFFDELFAENSDIRTELPLAISETWLRELGAPHESYVLTCLREPAKRLPKAIERAPGKVREGGPRMAGPAQFAPEKITVNLVWDPEEGHYQGSHAEPGGQNAEVVSSAASSAAAPVSAGGVVAPVDAASGVPPAIDPAAQNVTDPSGGP
jgi:hypothetical protein